MSSEARRASAQALQGRRAGFVSRAIATVIDLTVLVLVWFFIELTAGLVLFYLPPRRPFYMPEFPGWVASVGSALLILGYFSISWSLTGRTLGDQLFGLQVTDRAGHLLTFWRALARIALYFVFTVGFLWIVFSGRNASVQDLLLRTEVVHDWSRKPWEDRRRRSLVAPGRG
jgi:uncharacterized RDD family membrane protein YckC